MMMLPDHGSEQHFYKEMLEFAPKVWAGATCSHRPSLAAARYWIECVHAAQKVSHRSSHNASMKENGSN
jgi:hypothetical protein